MFTISTDCGDLIRAFNYTSGDHYRPKEVTSKDGGRGRLAGDLESLEDKDFAGRLILNPLLEVGVKIVDQ